MGRCHITEFAGPPSAAPNATGDHYVDTSSNQTYISVGTSSVSDWVLVNSGDTLISTSVDASSTLDVDVIPLTSLCAVKYVVCLSNTSQDKFKSFEMLARRKTTTTVEDSVYSVIGAALDVDVDFTVSGSDAKLVFTNNETYSVEIRVQRVILT